MCALQMCTEFVLEMLDIIFGRPSGRLLQDQVSTCHRSAFPYTFQMLLEQRFGFAIIDFHEACEEMLLPFQPYLTFYLQVTKLQLDNEQNQLKNQLLQRQNQQLIEDSRDKVCPMSPLHWLCNIPGPPLPSASH